MKKIIFAVFAALNMFSVTAQYGITGCPTDITLGTNSDGTSNYNSSTIVQASNGVYPSINDPNDIYVLNCSVTGASIYSGTGTVAGVTLNIGVNFVTYTLVGNYPTGTQNKTCSFTITVVDNEAPRITTSSVQTTIQNRCDFETALFPSPSATDNTSVSSKITMLLKSQVTALIPGCASKAAGTKYIKQITRTWEAKDEAGNTSTRTNVIKLADEDAPSIIAVKDITIVFGALTSVSRPASDFNNGSKDACSGAVVTLRACNNTTPTCTNFSTSVSFAKSLIPVGQTQITVPVLIRVIDACNNITLATANAILKRT